MDVRGQWYRCSRCGKDAQVSNDGRIKVCCWADKYPVEPPDQVEALDGANPESFVEG